MSTPESKQFATREEVEGAIAALSDADKLRIGQFAAWRVRGLGRATGGYDADDLLSEAVTATLVGAETSGDEGRRWNKQVDLVRHLTEVMRSISSHWREQYKNEPGLESELVSANDAEEVSNPLERTPDDQPSAIREAIAKQRVARIMARFKDDDDAILVLEGWREGWNRSDFGSIGMPTSRYDATVKRIRYALRDER